MIERTNFVDTKHEGMIHDAQYDYYGRKLATCSSDGTIQIFDVTKDATTNGETTIELASFKAHNGPVWQLAWAHPKFGNVLTSCGFDKKVNIWREVKSGEWQEAVNFELQSSVNAIVWAPWECGLKLLACCADGTISFFSRRADDQWDLPFTFPAHDSSVNSISWAALHSGNDYFAEEYNEKYAPLPKFASASCDKTVKIWEYQEGHENKFVAVAELKDQGHSDWVRDVTWSPSIGAPYETLVSCSEDGTVIFWKNSKSGQNDFKNSSQKKCNGPAWRLSFSFGGHLLAVSTAANNSENLVEIYKENEQGAWEKVSEINEQS